MFGKKKDEQPTSGTAAALTDGDAKSYAKPEVATPPAPSRPAMNPDIARRSPDMSAFAPRPAAGGAPTPPPVRAHEAEQKKLIVGRDIFLNGEIRTCDSLVVEGRVEAVLSDCRAIDIAQSGEFKGSAEIESADISGRFDGDLIVRQRLTIRATGKILGKIRYGQLEVERGGVISGTLEALADGTLVGTPVGAPVKGR